ncbi:hypothetical protein [Pseudaminobacter soli (ex Li et al. 2025)]|nr:hypothetical protein [Mesorhizobium soli]
MTGTHRPTSVVIVTCDDRAEYVRYRLTINRGGTSATIEEL